MNTFPARQLYSFWKKNTNGTEYFICGKAQIQNPGGKLILHPQLNEDNSLADKSRLSWIKIDVAW